MEAKHVNTLSKLLQVLWPRGDSSICRASPFQLLGPYRLLNLTQGCRMRSRVMAAYNNRETYIIGKSDWDIVG